jgi:hypothetical protein
MRRGRVLAGVSVVPEYPGVRAAATGPQAGPAKMEKMEKIIDRIEKILVRMEKILVKVENNYCIFLAGLELLPRGRNAWVAFRQNTGNVHRDFGENYRYDTYRDNL